MAWTLHLLFGITVITASAFKCKLSLEGANAGSNPNYHNQEGIADGVKSAQLRGQQPTSRTENEAKVLNWKPSLQSRQGENNDKIVFPGPTSDEFQLVIPDHCKRLGICDDVPNYPQELVNKVIAESPDLISETDKLDVPDVPDIAQRVGPQEENIELCNYQEKVVYPKAAVDSGGKWHVVLNQDENPIQGFKVEVCDVDSAPCSEIASFQMGYEARCKQKYVYRKMVVLSNGTKLERSLKVPSCCSCVAKLVLN